MKIKDFIKDNVVYPMVIEGLDGLRYAEITGKEILERHYTSDNNTVSFVNNDENIKSYPRPAEWIKYIANGNSNLEFHYTNKWKRFCEANKTTAAAILAFYNDLDSKAEVRFIEYVANH